MNGILNFLFRRYLPPITIKVGQVGILVFGNGKFFPFKTQVCDWKQIFLPHIVLRQSLTEPVMQLAFLPKYIQRPSQRNQTPENYPLNIRDDTSSPLIPNEVCIMQQSHPQFPADESTQVTVFFSRKYIYADTFIMVQLPARRTRPQQIAFFFPEFREHMDVIEIGKTVMENVLL